MTAGSDASLFLAPASSDRCRSSSVPPRGGRAREPTLCDRARRQEAAGQYDWLGAIRDLVVVVRLLDRSRSSGWISHASWPKRDRMEGVEGRFSRSVTLWPGTARRRSWQYRLARPLARADGAIGVKASDHRDRARDLAESGLDDLVSVLPSKRALGCGPRLAARTLQGDRTTRARPEPRRRR